MTQHIEEARKLALEVRNLPAFYQPDVIAAALAAAEERGMPQWQTIDTAPISNGSNRFLAQIIGHGACVCYAGAGRYIYSVQTGKRIHRATHWMPLPAPPAITKEPTP